LMVYSAVLLLSPSRLLTGHRGQQTRGSGNFLFLSTRKWELKEFGVGFFKLIELS